MKTFNTTLALSTLGIIAMLASPAFAQKPNRQLSQEQTIGSQAVEQYPASVDGMSHTGSASNQFDHDHGFYAGGNG